MNIYIIEDYFLNFDQGLVFGVFAGSVVFVIGFVIAALLDTMKGD